MRPSQVVYNDKITNRDKFGFFVRERRQELGISVRAMAEMLGISGAYLSDIEKGNRMAPLDHLDQMAAILKIEEDEKEFFVDLSGCSHSNWPEINEYLAKTKGARTAIRIARDYGVSEDEFLAIIVAYIEEREKQEKAQAETPAQRGEE